METVIIVIAAATQSVGVTKNIVFPIVNDDQGPIATALINSLRKQLDVPKNVNGVVVTGIADNSRAAELGIEVGDVIRSIDQQAITSPQEAANKLRDIKPGSAASALVLLNRHGVNRYVALSAEGKATDENNG